MLGAWSLICFFLILALEMYGCVTVLHESDMVDGYPSAGNRMNECEDYPGSFY
jgi:hypothetical protein